MRKSLEITLTTVLVAGVLTIVAWFTVPRFFGYEPQVVLSGSMEPKLNRGGVVLVKHRPGTDISLGDMLTYRHPERPASDRILVTHRVIEVLQTPVGPTYRTRGDANDGDDPWTVRPEHVIGTVEWHVPYLGFAAQSARSPLGLTLLVGVPAAFLAAGEVRNIWKALQQRKPKAMTEVSKE